MRLRGILIGLAVCALAVTAGLAVWGKFDRGQGQTLPVKIGILQFSAVDAMTGEGFKAGMADFGFQEGSTVVYDHDDPAGRIDRLPGIVDAMLMRGVDFIFVSSTPATLAVLKATRARPIPVIFAPVNDPLNAGIISDLRRPGGNVTGIRLPTGDDLRLDWLKRIAPGTKSVLVPHVPTDMSALATLEIIGGVAPALGVEIFAEPVGSCEDVSAAMSRHAGVVDAIFLPRDSLVEACIDGIVAFANSVAIPVVAPSLTQVHRGALFSYGFVHYEIGRSAARLMNQVIRGISPGDLPVEAAESYLAINTAAASTIGLHIPDKVLAIADIVIRD